MARKQGFVPAIVCTSPAAVQVIDIPVDIFTTRKEPDGTVYPPPLPFNPTAAAILIVVLFEYVAIYSSIRVSEMNDDAGVLSAYLRTIENASHGSPCGNCICDC